MSHKPDMAIFTKRNTTLTTRTKRLIKKLFPQIKDTFLSYYGDTSGVTIGHLATTYLLEQLEHFKKHHSHGIFERIPQPVYKEALTQLIQITLPAHYPSKLEHFYDLPNPINAIKDKKTLYTTPLLQLQQTSPNEFIRNISIEALNFKIKDYLTDQAIYIAVIAFKLYPTPIPLTLYDRPLEYLMFWRHFTKSPNLKLKDILPGVYFKEVKRFYMYYPNVLSLAKFINSKKRAKKYTRIILKRTKIYPKEKRPWVKNNTY